LNISSIFSVISIYFNMAGISLGVAKECEDDQYKK